LLSRSSQFLHISGSNFWIPIYFIWLGIDPKTSFWLALLTMIFGFGSGIVRNVTQKTVHWTIVKQYLKIAVPCTILGTLLVPFAPANLLLELFGSFVILYGAFLVYRFGLFYKERAKIFRIWAALAGFLKGLIATGTGKIIMPCVLKHSDIRTPAEAVGSTVVIILVVNLFATCFRLTPDFVSTLAEQSDLILSMMIWVAPGVMIGGQIGPLVAKKIVEKGNTSLCGDSAGHRWSIDIHENIFCVGRYSPDPSSFLNRKERNEWRVCRRMEPTMRSFFLLTQGGGSGHRSPLPGTRMQPSAPFWV
jgi:uncharacterized membrane protein YfcA